MARIVVVDEFVEDSFLLGGVKNGHRDPAWPFAGLDLHAILVILPFELNVIQQDEQVRLLHAVQVSLPRQEMRLVDRDDHANMTRKIAQEL